MFLERFGVERTNIDFRISQKELVAHAEAKNAFEWRVDSDLVCEGEILKVRCARGFRLIQTHFSAVSGAFKRSRPIQPLGQHWVHHRGVAVVEPLPQTCQTLAVRNDKPVRPSVVHNVNHSLPLTHHDLANEHGDRATPVEPVLHGLFQLVWLFMGMSEQAMLRVEKHGLDPSFKIGGLVPQLRTRRHLKNLFQSRLLQIGAFQIPRSVRQVGVLIVVEVLLLQCVRLSQRLHRGQ